MKKKLLLLVLTLLPMVTSINALAHDFEAVNSEGKTIYYKLNSDCITVSVSCRGNDYSSYSNEYSGDIVIPESVTYNGKSYPIASIDDYAFYACDNLLSVTIPNTITYIGMGAFHLSDGSPLHDIVINITDLKAWCDIDFSGGEGIGWPFALYLNGNLLDNLVIPNGVTTIRQGAFTNCYLTSISIPEGVTSIEDYAFCSQMSGSVTVSIPSTVASIGYQAFGCSGLTSVIVNQNTPIVLNRPVFSYSYQATLYVPYGSKTKYEAADYWKDFKKIVEMAPSSSNIEFADTNVKALCVANWDTSGDGELSEEEAAAVTDLGSVFKQNTTIMSFDELQYFTGLTAIGASAFLGCSSLINICIPNSVTTIGSSVFEGCISLTSVNIPCSVTTLENRLFYSCEHLKKVVFPNSVKSIPANLYLGYTNKPSYGFTSIDGTVENIHVPSSVTWIGRYAINQCDTVVIEDGSTELILQDRNADDGYWDGALSHVKKIYVGRNMGLNGSSYSGQVFCALNSSSTELSDVIFGPFVTRAFTGTSFRNCSHVSSVTCLSKEPFPSPDFYQIPQTAVLHVPLGSKQKYESAQGWSNFKGIQEVTEVTITLDDTEMVYAGDFDLDFSQVSGLQVFTAGDYDVGTSSITFNPVQIVSAGKGVILKGDMGTYTVPCINIEPMSAEPLCGTISGRFIRKTQDNNVNYFFDKVEHVFKPVDAVYGCQLSRNEAYLSLPSSSISGSGGIITPLYKEDKPVDDKKCATPTISYANGKVLFTCETEGVDFVSNAEPVGGTTYENGEMTLPTTYRVSVYAKKDGFQDSDTAIKEVTVTGGLTGDVNNDGKVTITDAVSVVNIILNNGETAAPALESPAVEAPEVGEPE